MFVINLKNIKPLNNDDQDFINKLVSGYCCTNCFHFLINTQLYKCSKCKKIFCNECFTQIQKDKNSISQNNNVQLKDKQLNDDTTNKIQPIDIQITCTQDNCPGFLIYLNESKKDNTILILLKKQLLYSCPSQQNQTIIERCQTKNYMDLNQLIQHYQECQQIKTKCLLKGCYQMVIKRDLQSHTEACAYSIKYCEYCKNQIIKHQMPNHINQCEYKFKCEFCSKTISKTIQIQHISDCANEQLKCEDCSTILKRHEKLNNHSIRTCIKIQLQDLHGNILETQQFFDNKISVIKEFQEQTINNLVQQQEELEEQKSSIEDQAVKLVRKKMERLEQKDQFEKSRQYKASLKITQTTDLSSRKRFQSDYEGQQNDQQQKQKFSTLTKQLQDLKALYMKQLNLSCKVKNFWKENKWNEFLQLSYAHDPKNTKDPLDQCDQCYILKLQYDKTLTSLKQNLNQTQLIQDQRHTFSAKKEEYNNQSAYVIKNNQ